MNKQKFLNLINDHQNVSDKDVDSLESLVSEYPYCQIGHILLSDIYSQTGSVKADDKLHLTAVYATDRTLLKHILLGTDLEEPTPQAVVEEAKATEKEITHTDEISEVEDELTVEAEKPVVEPVAEVVAETAVEPIEAKAAEVAKTAEVAEGQVSEAVEEAIEAEAESTEVESIEDLLVNSSTEEPSLTLDKIEKEEEGSIYKQLEENLKALRERKSPSDTDKIASNAPEILAKSSKSTSAKKARVKTAKVAAKKTTPKPKVSKAKKPVSTKSSVKKSPAVKKASAKRAAPKVAAKSSNKAASKKAPTKKIVTKRVATKKTVASTKSAAATAIKKAKAPAKKKPAAKKAAPVKKNFKQK